MDIHSILIDGKILGINVSGTMTFGEYVPLAQQIIKKNDLQRKRVKSDKSPYRLLSRDLVDQCVMPPITLATSESYSNQHATQLQSIVQNKNVSSTDKSDLKAIIADAISQKEVLILDGLQRTYTILDVFKTLENDESRKQDLDRFTNAPFRFECYMGLRKTGILYRMMTLNTAQTPMSFRHQLEILYHDYINKDDLPDNIKIVKESDNERARGIDRFQYRDTIDMFYAFSSGESTPADRSAVIDKLSEFSFLENYSIDSNEPLDLLVTYHALVAKIHHLTGDWTLEESLLSEHNIARPFGRTTDSIFCRSQAMTGFGAEVSRLIKRGQVKSVEDIRLSINALTIGDHEPRHPPTQLVIFLDEIAKNSKRIGDDQRTYFQLFWRHLLMPESDTMANLSDTPAAAYNTFINLYR